MMVTLSQILIKIGHDLPHAQAWEGDRPVQITRPDFERVLRSPGPFLLDSKKTIREKWDSLTCYPGLVVSKAPQTGKAVVLGLDPAVARSLIIETMPRAMLRRNAMEREHYLKTGEYQ